MRTALLLCLLVAVAVGARYANENPEIWRDIARVWLPREPVAEPAITPPLPARKTAPAQRPVREPAASEAPQNAEAIEDTTERSCEAPPTRAVEKIERPKVHRWVDGDGKVHYSDKVPTDTTATVYQPRIRTRRQYFTVEITYEGLRSVPFLKDRLRAQATKMYEILALLVGAERLRQVELNIRVFEHAADYNRYAQTLSPRLANTSGFYSLARNEAVTYQHHSDESTQATARHEATHVIVAGLFGRVPTWLNEGLAEYFEVLTVEAQQVRIRPQQRWFEIASRTMARGYPPEPKDFMALRGADWYDNNREVHYALGWSLVHFLMSSDDGRTALGDYLGELADHYCEEVDGFAWLARGYPSGYAGFARDFRNWLANAELAAHSH